MTIQGQSVQSVEHIATKAAEVLFDTSTDTGSITELVLNSLLLAPRELRPQLATHIVVCGGGAMLPGFCTRLVQELEETVQQDPRFCRLEFQLTYDAL